MKGEKNWILFVNYNSYPCNIGGLEIFNKFLIEKISEKYDTHVLTTCNKIKEYNSIQVHKLRKYFFNKITSPFKTFVFVAAHVKKIGIIHVSYANGYWLHFYIYVLIKKVLGVNYFVTIHDGDIKAWHPEWAIKSFFRNASAVTGVSQSIIESYQTRIGRSDLIFTPPLIPFEVLNKNDKLRDKWSVKIDETILLYVGSLKPLKSVETLIEAVAKIPQKIISENKLKILIAGDGPSRGGLELLAKELKCDSIISFLGIVDRSELNELYSIANLYTICSEYEGLPISLLEALANQLPCITSNAPGLIEISKKDKVTLTFTTKNSLEFSNKIITLLENKDLRSKYSVNGFTYFQNLHSYEKLLSKFDRIISENI